jgi:hypothetical protein
MKNILIANWKESGIWAIARLKLKAFLELRSPKFYSLKYIEINTQIDTALLRHLLQDIPEIECIDDNYRIVATPKKRRKLNPKQKAAKELNGLRDRAANHAIAKGIPKTKARLAAMNAFCDRD